jgi:hypothetical protein
MTANAPKKKHFEILGDFGQGSKKTLKFRTCNISYTKEHVLKYDH